MKSIPLTQGKVALVDDQDFERLSRYKWHFKQSKGGYTGYAARMTRVAGKRFRVYMHHEVLGINQETDHRDLEGLNNQRHNLRPATRGQNVMNGRLRKDNTTKAKGVTLCKKTGRFQARFVNSDGKRVSLGHFGSVDEASAAYLSAAREKYGEFVRA